MVVVTILKSRPVVDFVRYLRSRFIGQPAVVVEEAEVIHDEHENDEHENDDEQ